MNSVRRAIGIALVLTGVFGLVVSAAFFANQPQTYTGWGPMGGMMGGGMMGGMMGGYNVNPTGPRITIDQATKIAQTYLASSGNPDLAIDEIMEFQNNFYVIYYEKSTGVRAFEMLIDPYTGRTFPEYGPNMMWNTKYGMMNGMGGWGMGPGMMGGSMMGNQRGPPTANMPVTKQQAATIAENYLKTFLPGASTEEPDVFYGYYTIHITQNGKIYGMLSVNGYSGQVWYHSWHGEFIQVKEF